MKIITAAVLVLAMLLLGSIVLAQGRGKGKEKEKPLKLAPVVEVDWSTLPWEAPVPPNPLYLDDKVDSWREMVESLGYVQP